MPTSTQGLDMKKGTRALPALLGLALSSLLTMLILSYRAFSRLVQKDVQVLFAQARPAEDGVVTEETLRGLPAPLQRYLRYTGVLGKPLVHTVHLKQAGRIRMGERAWMPLVASEVFTVQPPGFVWDCTLRAGPLPLVQARDMYQSGKGEMLVKLGAVFTVANAAGEEMDQAEMVRYFSEMIWFPTSFLGNNLSFTPIDDHTVQATLSDRGRSVNATLHIDDDGRLAEFRAERSYGAGDQRELRTWSVPITGYGEFEGLKLPVKVRAVWKLPEGDQEYIDITVTELEYGVANETQRKSEAVQEVRTTVEVGI